MVKGSKHSDETKARMNETHAKRKIDGYPTRRKEKILNGKGYVMVHVPLHPHSDKRGYMMEHRLVIENSIGRFLLSDEVVHHRDGDIFNNNIENLQLFSSSRDHLKHHAQMRKINKTIREKGKFLFPWTASLDVNVDDRGILYEVLRTDRKDIAPNGVEMKQTYIVKSKEAGTVRGFHRHKKTWDWFHIIKGSATFLFMSDDEPTESSVVTKIVLSSESKEIIVVPPGIWHGWVALEPDTTLLSTASECYDKECPDETRIPWDTIGKDIWEIQYK